jgi:hypothetical protein
MKDIKVEVQYRQLVTYMIDFIVLLDDPKVLWLIESGFINAKDCADESRGGDWDGCGYWEFVYVSIASNIDDYFPDDPRFKPSPDRGYLIKR